MCHVCFNREGSLGKFLRPFIRDDVTIQVVDRDQQVFLIKDGRAFSLLADGDTGGLFHWEPVDPPVKPRRDETYKVYQAHDGTLTYVFGGLPGQGDRERERELGRPVYRINVRYKGEAKRDWDSFAARMST